MHDDQRSGRPSIVTDKIVEKINNAAHDKRRLTLDELSATFPDIFRSVLHEKIKELLILEIVCEMGPKTADRTTQVESRAELQTSFGALEV